MTNRKNGEYIYYWKNIIFFFKTLFKLEIDIREISYK